MEDSKSNEANITGQASTTILTSSETLISEVIDDKNDSDYQQEITIETSELKVMKYVPDISLVDKDRPSSGNIATNNLQEDIAEDSEHSLQQNVPDVSSSNPHISVGENFDSNNLQGMTAADSDQLVQQDVLDSSMNHNQPNTPDTSNMLGTPDGDAVLESSGTPFHSSSHPSEKSKQQILQQAEDGSSSKVADNHVTDASSISTRSRKTEETPALLPIKLDHQNVAANTKKSAVESVKSSSHVKKFDVSRGLVDTAAPIESVKEVVSKFGGIIDWKAHSVHTQEKSKHVRSELERIRKEIPECGRQSEAAEEAKVQVLNELESTKRIVEELKLNLERAQTEEDQARQDSELAELRVKEMEQGIAGESSIAAKAQLEVAKARYEKAVAELKSVKEELYVLQGAYASLLKERDLAVRKAEDATSASKSIEKTIEELTLELITTKEALESAHAAHLEAEEHRIGAVLAREQDYLTWEKEQKEAEEEVERLNQQLLSTKDLKLKLDTASSLLLDLKTELAAYMESKLNEESGSIEDEKSLDGAKGGKKTETSRALTSTRKELEEVKASIDKAKDEVNILRVAASSLKSELEREKSALMTLQQREGMASIAVSSLEAELERTKEELEVVRVKEKEAREKMVELPKLLQQAAQEADQANSVAQMAREELQKAKEEAEQVKVGATTIDIRLNAALKEIEAAKASERLALAAIKALEESEQAAVIGGVDSPTGVTLPLDEYYNLSKRAHEAEMLAHERLAATLQQIEVAKDLESKSLTRLEEAQRERDERKEAWRLAMDKAEKAKKGKLGTEQELRDWRAEHEQRRKATDAARNAANPLMSPPRSFKKSNESKSFKKEEADVLVHPIPDEKLDKSESTPETANPSMKASKKKKSLFPRIAATLLAHNKKQSVK